MDKYRQSTIDLMIAIEAKQDKKYLEKLIERIKGTFNQEMEFKYNQALKRAQKD